MIPWIALVVVCILAVLIWRYGISEVWSWFTNTDRPGGDGGA